MLAILLSPIYIALNFYIAKWLIYWIENCNKHVQSKKIKTIIIGIYTFFASSIIIGFFLPAGPIQKIIKSIGNYWLGVLVYVIIIVFIADGIRLILYKSKKIPKEKLSLRKTIVTVGTICIISILTISIIGAINARQITITKYQINVEKIVKNKEKLKIVMVADLHLGYNIGCRQMQQMVKKINQEKPDVVAIAGDIFDNEYKALDNPKKLIKIFKQIKSKYGVYAVYGNHDVEEKVLAGFTFSFGKKKKVSNIKMDQLLEKANINLLRDEGVLIDNRFYLYGRPDYKKLGRGITKRKTPEQITKNMDKEKPIIVIDHQPRQLQELQDAGVDIDLSGHTHNGQLFPGNLLLPIMWENPYGYRKKGKMHSFVTSGIGLFGPNMRVGSKAEIVSITVTFKH